MSAAITRAVSAEQTQAALDVYQGVFGATVDDLLHALLHELVVDRALLLLEGEQALAARDAIYETPEGFVGPCEMLVGAGTR